MPSKLIAVGISHHIVPVEYREMVALSADEVRRLLILLKESYSDEALVLSTCNRSEIYIRPNNLDITAEYLVDLLLETKRVPQSERAFLRTQFAKLAYCDAILHLFDVVAGIDSQVFGDQQIFTQVKESFRLAEEVGSAGTFMTKFAHAAFRVAKRARTETNIAIGAGTISYAAVEFARRVYDDLENNTALIIGAGETAELAASYLIERHIGTVHIVNRTIEHAEALLDKLRMKSPLLRSRTATLSDIGTLLPQADIIISSTGSPELILHEDQMRTALNERRSPNPVVIIDIAVPRDVDPRIAELPNVFLKDIDDLSAIVDQNIEKKKEEVPKIKNIINEEFKTFLAIFAKLEVGPTIAELRHKFESIRLEELDRHRSKVSTDEFEKIDEMTRKMFNRLLHTPTIMLKEPRTTNDDLQARIELVRLLFALDSNTHEENQ